jgi:predicted metal-dependent hydrolase
MELQTNYIIERKEVKHARININEERRVKLIIPESFSQDDISRLIAQKSGWIQKQLDFFGQEMCNPIELQPGQVLLFGEAYTPGIATSKNDLITSWYKETARNYFINRLAELSAIHNLKFNKFFVRDTKTKWGNCSREYNLSLNWRLIKAPKYVIDYVILHELTHTLILKHTQAFWLKLSIICPKYKEASNWLTKYGKSLL